MVQLSLEDGKTFFEPSLKRWMLGRTVTLKRYVYKNFDKYSREAIMDMLIDEKPMLGRTILRDFRTDNHIKLRRLYDKFRSGYIIGLIVGARGQGKTALACKIAENVYRYRPVVFLQTTLTLPDWVIKAESISDDSIPQGALIIVDEASLTFNAREAMSKEARDLGTWLATTRHKNFSVLFISQHTQLVDVNIMRFSDVMIFKKLSWEEMNAGGRENMNLLYEYMQFMIPKDETQVLFTDGNNWHRADIKLPTFWSDKISTSYRKLTLDEGKKLALAWYKKGMTPKQIERQLRNRNLIIFKDQLETFLALEGNQEWRDI